ncbi:MAG: hypothetical protein ABSB35_18600 [Bryobacteraceae bacterium]|jgi:hypothetical protein
MSFSFRRGRTLQVIVLAIATLYPGARTSSAQNQPGAKPYIEEWVYKVKWGHQDEFWQLFKKYQIPVLNKEKEQGGILRYEVFQPSLHASNDHRWDLRIIIYYKTATSGAVESTISRQLFPDREAFKRDDLRRWEITEDHWDLPISQMEPNADTY